MSACVSNHVNMCVCSKCTCGCTCVYICKHQPGQRRLRNARPYAQSPALSRRIINLTHTLRVCPCMGDFSVMDTEVMGLLLDEPVKAESCVAFSGDAGSQWSEAARFFFRETQCAFLFYSKCFHNGRYSFTLFPRICAAIDFLYLNGAAFILGRTLFPLWDFKKTEKFGKVPIKNNCTQTYFQLYGSFLLFFLVNIAFENKSKTSSIDLCHLLQHS